MISNLSPRANRRLLAFMIVAAASMLVAAVRLMPVGVRGVNFVPFGALLLFAGARLAPRSLLLLAFWPVLATDLYFNQVRGWEIPAWNYLSYAVYLAIGLRWLRHTESTLRIGTLSIVAAVQFFLISNFGVWLQQAIRPDLYAGQPYEYSANFAGLMKCYAMAIPFFWGTLLSDLLFTGLFLKVHSLLARAYSPREVAVASISHMENQS